MIYPRPSALDSCDLDGVQITFTEIHHVIDAFYGKVQLDSQLKIPFGSVEDWNHHVDRLTHFWWIRLGGRPYQEGMYNPVEKHFRAGFNPAFLSRWLDLFHQTLIELLKPEAAERWFEIVSMMGQALSFKNEQYSAYRNR